MRSLTQLGDRYRRIRRATVALAEPLAIEDQVVQTMPDVSPTRWHLAHTSWFFETFVLVPARRGYRPIDERYSYLFNSYYHAVGDRPPQAERGQLSRPTVAEVLAYRAHVDRAMDRLLEDLPSPLLPILELGLAHEEQHQELVLTDIKHVLWRNPLEPAYRHEDAPAPGTAPPLRWIGFAGGEHDIGDGGDGFAFDNERPRHRVRLEAFELASRLSTCAEYLAFIEDGGYDRSELWLADGWDACQRGRWRAPLYWQKRDGTWWHYTLGGSRPVEPAEPVCHVSYYEADAFARWSGARLPLEFEWERAAAAEPPRGHFVDSGRLHPLPAASGGLEQLYGDVWEWTSSAYQPYPRYAPPAGALGEYNGKFMANRMVLRGGSCVTPPGHIRKSYRNFFPPDARWQFFGIRLARWAEPAKERIRR